MRKYPMIVSRDNICEIQGDPEVANNPTNTRNMKYQLAVFGPSKWQGNEAAFATMQTQCHGVPTCSVAVMRDVVRNNNIIPICINLVRPYVNCCARSVLEPESRQRP